SPDTFEPWHNGVHFNVGGDMAMHHTSPKDPVFWRLHELIDRDIYGRWPSSQERSKSSQT
ncbi:MAG: tyrosinase family protein, partial [Gemmataceae bacterium]|nr:tyrosinase family protein [Gemmataceae bacterium]